jgi:hypothetical protein
LLASKADIISGAAYQEVQEEKASVLGSLASSLYNSTFGYFAAEPEEESSEKILEQQDDLVCMEYLADRAKKVLEWAAKEEKPILQLADL